MLQNVSISPYTTLFCVLFFRFFFFFGGGGDSYFLPQLIFIFNTEVNTKLVGKLSAGVTLDYALEKKKSYLIPTDNKNP